MRGNVSAADAVVNVLLSAAALLFAMLLRLGLAASLRINRKGEGQRQRRRHREKSYDPIHGHLRLNNLSQAGRDPHPPSFCKDLIPWELRRLFLQGCDSIGFVGTAEFAGTHAALF
jgi:hypothetical protein